MYEIDLSTVMLIGINNQSTKVVTLDDEFIVNENCKKIIDDSCKYFGSTMRERVNYTNRLVKISSKAPIIIEESRNIIFFPIRSIREVCNTWISFNNLEKYLQMDKKTVLIFKGDKKVELDYSYYIIDNQVTRSMMLDYEILKRRQTLDK